MTRIVGIDPSLAATGIAVITDHGDNGELNVTADTIPTKPAPGIDGQLHRMSIITARVIAHADLAQLAVIEGPSYASKGGQAWDRGGLWWRIVSALHGHDIPLAVAPPSNLKKWATGRGNAEKAAVIAAMCRLWPDVELRSDNEADALTAASAGAVRCGLLEPRRKSHTDTLAGVQWPDFGPHEDRFVAEDIAAARTADAAGTEPRP